MYLKQRKINIILDSKNSEGDGMKKSTGRDWSFWLHPLRTDSWICDADLFPFASINPKHFTESKGFTSEYS